MYLKSLILRGFKSFADKTALSLEPGVTVVVGPNGSGKSNICDAVMWVLGEQSARSLRGGSMEDVIFAGSAGRDPVGICEVSLVLDNSDHTLPIEFSEVTISRRMFRSGESEYMINNSPCRLLDIQELLSDSGVGRDTSSIIGQGGLDDTVNGRPEERRALIEEAAGIVKHKKRKERAVRKLELMESNLVRARDVLAEVNRQFKPLEQQAEVAEQYEGLSRELQDCQISLAVLELRKIQSEWEKLISEEEALQGALETAREEFAAKDEHVRNLQGVVEAKGVYAGDLGEQRRRLQASLERISSGLLLLEEKGKNLIERLSDLRAKIHGSESKLGRLRREMTRLADEKKSSDAQITATYADLANQRRVAEAGKKKRLRAAELVEEMTGAITHNKAVLAENQKEIHSLKGHVRSLGLQREFLVAREAAAAKRLERVGAQLAGAHEAEVKAQASAEACKGKVLGLQEQIDRRLAEVQSKTEQVSALSAQLAQCEAKAATLEELSKPFAAASPALAWLLSQRPKVSGLVGMVGDLIEVEKRYEKVIEVALGSDLFCVVTKNTAAARKAIDFLRAKKAGEIAFMAAAGAKSARNAKKTGLPGKAAIEVVKCKAGAKKVVELLLADVRIVETLDEALDAAARGDGFRYVTMDGESAWPSGKVSLGALPEGGAGMLLRKRELADLRGQAKRIASARTAESKAASAAKEKLEKVQTRVMELSRKAQELEDVASETSGKVRYLQADIERMSKERSALAKELNRVTVELRREEPRSKSLAKQNSRIEKELAGLEKKLVVAKEQHDEHYREELEKSQLLAQCQVDIASLTERSVFTKRRDRTLAVEIAELEGLRASEDQVARSLETLRGRIQPVHKMYSALLTRAQAWADRLTKQALAEQSDAATIRGKLHEAQEEAREAGAKAEQTSGGLAELRVTKGQLEMRVNSAVTRIVDEYDIPIERALQQKVDPADRERLEQKGRALRGKLARLGAINPIAMEEYRRLRERQEFLSAQVDDLTSSRKALAKVIGAIDKKMKDQFLGAFEEVNKHFQSVFSILFPGGRAELFLTDGDDPFDAGVDIEAQPSGKKLQKLSLLSAGERALVAVALLFAIHYARPSPFYILDEVEAALDDLNLQRFVGLLQTLRAQSQFIVISHQRRTMEVAECLYGVSMQADGVSRLVSQKLPAREAG